ncbi:MAG: PEGA domain-containing protein [Phycisphaerales bacterium]
MQSPPRIGHRHARRPLAALGGLAVAAAGFMASGCVERTVSITSEPSGALVYLNDREIGRTPLETGFVHYGTFDVRLVREGSEPLTTVGEARAPIWDTVPLDFFAEIAPLPFTSRIEWHFDLEPVRTDSAGLLERAGGLRSRLVDGDGDGDGDGDRHGDEDRDPDGDEHADG